MSSRHRELAFDLSFVLHRLELAELAVVVDQLQVELVVRLVPGARELAEIAATLRRRHRAELGLVPPIHGDDCGPPALP